MKQRKKEGKIGCKCKTEIKLRNLTYHYGIQFILRVFCTFFTIEATPQKIPLNDMQALNREKIWIKVIRDNKKKVFFFRKTSKISSKCNKKS